MSLILCGFPVMTKVEAKSRLVNPLAAFLDMPYGLAVVQGYEGDQRLVPVKWVAHEGLLGEPSSASIHSVVILG